MKPKHLIFLLALGACTADDFLQPDIPIGILEPSYTVNRFKVLEIKPNIPLSASFIWKVDGKEYSKAPVFEFISTEIAPHTLNLEVSYNGKSLTYTSTINVTEEDKKFSEYIADVLEYRPAVGQFINKLPAYEDQNTEHHLLAKAKKALVGDTKDLISLGGYGGFVIFSFDHTIPNLTGRDFKVLGNAFAGSSEPGIIMVAYDRNKNGKPDDNEWYEIAGSEHSSSETVKNYQITYFKPENEPSGEEKNYIKWEDNQGNSGFKSKNRFHSQSYYPLWLHQSTLSFSGTKLKDNYTQNGGANAHWTGKAYDFGYADNAPNESEASNIDISWAVDKNGKPVHLIGIDFIKVYTAINQEAGWLGEISTEIRGAYDLWIKNSTKNNK